MVIDHNIKKNEEVEIDLSHEHIEPMLQEASGKVCFIPNRAFRHMGDVCYMLHHFDG